MIVFAAIDNTDETLATQDSTTETNNSVEDIDPATIGPITATTLDSATTEETDEAATQEDELQTNTTEAPNQPLEPRPSPDSGTAVDAFTPVNGKRVIWGDNFDSLDQSRWAVETVSDYGSGNNEVQCYMPENTSVRGGQLVLTARKKTQVCNNGTMQYTSGMVRSRGVEFSPGQGIEFRVKLTPADNENQGGLWPAVWSSSWAGGGWPTGGELDYLEVMTATRSDGTTNKARPVFSMHFTQPNNQHKVINKHKKLDRPFSDEWHTVRFDYGKGGKLKWYLDGEVVHEVTSAETKQGYPAPFNQTIREIKINLALGGRPGPVDDRSLGRSGATFTVDYIKVFPL